MYSSMHCIALYCTFSMQGLGLGDWDDGDAEFRNGIKMEKKRKRKLKNWALSNVQKNRTESERIKKKKKIPSLETPPEKTNPKKNNISKMKTFPTFLSLSPLSFLISFPFFFSSSFYFRKNILHIIFTTGPCVSEMRSPNATGDLLVSRNVTTLTTRNEQNQKRTNWVISNRDENRMDCHVVCTVHTSTVNIHMSEPVGSLNMQRQFTEKRRLVQQQR